MKYTIRDKNVPDLFDVGYNVWYEWKKKYKDIVPKPKKLSAKLCLYKVSELQEFYDKLPNNEK
ncbi:hypothetical protein [Francisella tularensis]|uniref:hypothetical protein n=1 Tax=Francisella tularensis TaxID=263 RepID=UPI0008F4D369|nr:hypothetical protein [Francisella tularensis]APA83275.1 hypothetical protein N894_1291 [Francisella tularensis subsp. novicida PA10-7858]